MEKRYELFKAFKIGTISVLGYVACYYMRNLLSVATPSMVEGKVFGANSVEIIGTLSSFYMLAYACGQLINGVLGDKIKAKYMVGGGLFASGITSLLFAFAGNFVVQLISFVLMGFALSMLRGPLVKSISENMKITYAQTCNVFLSCAAVFGPLIASALAIFFKWKNIFIVAGAFTVLLGVVFYMLFDYMEKKGLIKYTSSGQKGIDFKGLGRVFKLQHFGIYMFAGMLIEISGAAISFWTPTYINEYLHFPAATANIIFSVMSVILSIRPFIALSVFRFFKNQDIKMMVWSFLSATIFFSLLIFVKEPYLNIVFFILARLSVGFASTLLWSIYIPSQGKTGLVSTLNGVLDFSGYAATFIANLIFTFSMSLIGWTGIIAIWAGLMLSGCISTFAVQIKDKKKCFAE